MKDGDTKTGKLPQQPWQSGEFRSLFNQILECANSGIPRIQFFREVLQLLVSYSTCDIIRLVLYTRGHRYSCASYKDTNQPFRFDEKILPESQLNKFYWGVNRNSDLEKICQKISNRIYDPTLPCFTRHGSFWTNNINDFFLSESEISGTEMQFGIRVDREYPSMSLIPVETDRKVIGVLQFVSDKEKFFNQQMVEFFEDVAQTIGIALSHRQLQVALRERVKELTCLYGLAKLVTHPGFSLDDVLKETVDLLPPALLYPKEASARIVVDDKTYLTSNFKKSVQTMMTDIIIQGEKRGFIEIGYTWEKPQLDEGPFLNEERNLIETIAQELAVILEQSRAEKEKTKLQEQLRHADRLATIGQLAAGVAHEINEPLANILGFAQLITKDTTLGEQTNQDIGRIIMATLHAREVIKKLLVFAREATPAKESMNLNELIEDGLRFLEFQCTKNNIELISKLSNDIPAIVADRSQLLQVLINLVVNSVQAMPEGGQLTVSSSKNNDMAILTVEDTGIGMDKETVQNMFNPFFTTKDVNEGTGLGLSVVHGIVKSHGGTIEVDSKPGLGTRFMIKLPVETLNSDSEHSDEKEK